MKRVDLSILPEYLKSRRWFAGKAWPIKSTSVIDHASLATTGRTDFTLGVIEVTYELGKPERYLLPVTLGPKGKIEEALDDDQLARAVLGLIRDGSEVPSGAGALKGERIAGTDELWAALPDAPTVTRISAEQSNTSIIFGQAVILKLIRKLEHGVNPELELGRFFARRGFQQVPPLMGALHLTGSADSTIAVAHRFLPNEGDGWTYALERFREGPTLSPDVLDGFRKLGERLGELHTVLASDAEDPAFAPEPIRAEDLQRWSATIIGELGVTLAAATQVIPELEARRDALAERARKLATLEPSGQKTRVHGDLHLGQVLRTGDDWAIFDFEGEPARSFEQRRQKHSPLKDVAGMLRSFSYAAEVVIAEGKPVGTRSSSARRAFLQGYRAATAGAAFLPADDTTFAGLLDALELEKLIYEVRYEVNNRPDWVKIPAQSMLDEAGR